jgi:hypothetical protein
MDPYANGIAWMIEAPLRRREERDLAQRLALRNATSEGRSGIGDRIRTLLTGSARDIAPVDCCTSPSAA